jgi:hypothetical protein
MKSGKIFAGVAVALDFNAAATGFFTGAVKTAVLFEAETVVQLRTSVAGVIANSISEINGPSEILADNDANPTTFPQARASISRTKGTARLVSLATRRRRGLRGQRDPIGLELNCIVSVT